MWQVVVADHLVSGIALLPWFRQSVPMCGRFNVIDNPGLQQLLRDLGIDLQLPRAINVAPTEPVVLLRDTGEEVQHSLARWWLTPAWAKQVDQKYAMFNARCETLSSRAAFKKPFRSQRGIVAMSSFIEWRMEDGVKQPYKIGARSGGMAVAALWDVWSGGESPLTSCTLLTTAAAHEFAPWHSRMPVILAPTERERWLDNERIIADDDPVFASELKTDLKLVRLDRAVGNARRKDIELLQGVGEQIVLRGNTV